MQSAMRAVDALKNSYYPSPYTVRYDCNTGEIREILRGKERIREGTELLSSNNRITRFAGIPKAS